MRDEGCAWLGTRVFWIGGLCEEGLEEVLGGAAEDALVDGEGHSAVGVMWARTSAASRRAWRPWRRSGEARTWVMLLPLDTRVMAKPPADWSPRSRFAPQIQGPHRYTAGTRWIRSHG